MLVLLDTPYNSSTNRLTEYSAVAIPYCVTTETPRETAVPVAVKMPPELLREIDAHVAGLDITRSQYFRRLIREDLKRAGKIAQPEATPAPEEVAA